MPSLEFVLSVCLLLLVRQTYSLCPGSILLVAFSFLSFWSPCLLHLEVTIFLVVYLFRFVFSFQTGIFLFRLRCIFTFTPIVYAILAETAYIRWLIYVRYIGIRMSSLIFSTCWFSEVHVFHQLTFLSYFWNCWRFLERHFLYALPLYWMAFVLVSLSYSSLSSFISLCTSEWLLQIVSISSSACVSSGLLGFNPSILTVSLFLMFLDAF